MTPCFQDGSHYTIYFHFHCLIGKTICIIKNYKSILKFPIEKKQIINAWIVEDNELQKMSAEKYYNENYEHQTTD